MPLVIVRYPKPSIHSVQCFLQEKNDLVSKVFFVSSAFLLDLRAIAAFGWRSRLLTGD